MSSFLYIINKVLHKFFTELSKKLEKETARKEVKESFEKAETELEDRIPKETEIDEVVIKRRRSIPFINGYSIGKIKAIPKKQRPNPTRYLPNKYISEHLNLFDEGAVRFTSRASFQKYRTLGPEGAFVLPKKYFDEVIKKSGGDVRKIEKLLGFDEGYLRSDDIMIVYFERNDILDLRIPSGNEGGANKRWIPGGYTSGDTPEAVMDLNKKINFKEIKINFK